MHPKTSNKFDNEFSKCIGPITSNNLPIKSHAEQNNYIGHVHVLAAILYVRAHAELNLFEGSEVLGQSGP